MSKQAATQTMDNLTDQLWNLVVGNAKSGKVNQSLDESATSVMMCYPGIPIRSADFEQMRSEFNPQGDLRPLEAFSKWVDRMPDVNSPLRFMPTLNTVSAAYGNVVNAAESATEAPTEKELDAYNKAYKYLYVGEKNPFTGEESGIEVESEVFKKYKTKKKAYERAISKYVSQWTELDLNKPEDQKTWQKAGTTLQYEIDDAWDEWNSANRNYVEMALDLLGSRLKNLAEKAINDAGKVYSQSSIPSLTGGGNFYPAYTFPHKWWADADGWTNLHVKSDYEYLHTESHTKKAGGEASVNVGLFSLGGEGGYSKEHEKEEKETENLQISLKVAIVDIVRPWLRLSWMKSSNWKIRGEKAGKVSGGKISQLNNDLMLPLVPVQVIVARDIQLKADWSDKTKEKLESSVNAKAKVGYGPFTISGKYEQGDKEETVTSQINGNTLTVEGMQIIGFICSCPPFGAPLNG